MKKILNLFFVVLLTTTIYAQEGYVFKDIIRLPTTDVEDQYASGTCWAFAATSYIETEMVRKGMKLKDVPDLSEMYIVRKCYEQKAIKYIRMHGTINFGSGGAFFDLFWVYNQFGLMPEEAYQGLNYGSDKHNHSEVDDVLKAYVEALEEAKTLTTAWFEGYKGILDAYFGRVPEKFNYKGKDYTAREFADNIVKIDPSDYVSITSYTHHPFYSKFILEIPDNWIWEESYNVKIDELVTITDYALKNGYSIAWGADVSEVYFSYRDGIAVVPDLEIKELARTERSRWEAVDREKYNLSQPGKEKTISQEMRQIAFDNRQTTDDHGMHLIGLAKDQNGVEYYIVKNSWNTDNPYDLSLIHI